MYRPPQCSEREPDGSWEALLAHRRIDGDCWLWTGTVRARGAGGRGEPYGGVRYGGSVWLVHRLAWTLANGPIPEGLMVDHRCRRTLCFRPSHLRVVTPRQNAAGRDPAAVRVALDRGRATRWGAA